MTINKFTLDQPGVFVETSVASFQFCLKMLGNDNVEVHLSIGRVYLHCGVSRIFIAGTS